MSLGRRIGTLQKVTELVIVHLDRSSGTRSVVEVETIVFEPGKPIPSSSLSYSVLSIHGTNTSDSFTRFLTSIKGEKREVSKMRFFVDLTIHFTVLKKGKKEYFNLVEHSTGFLMVYNTSPNIFM